jgi:hypothetical protein
LRRLSSRIAERLVQDVEALGTAPVRLVGAAQPDLMLVEGGWRGAAPASAPKPLADWRALAWPQCPDESFVVLGGSPSDPAKVAACAAVERGPFPTLAGDGLLVRATEHVNRAHLRALQCRVSDPVSFALRDGDEVAQFPLAPGWSARDWARRAVAEHATWLASAGRPVETSGQAVGMLISAGRAAIFLETVQDGEPALPVTLAATLEALGSRSGSDRVAAEAAAEAYADFAALGKAPPDVTVRALERLVRQLPSYASR